MPFELTALETRILGCLLEKERLTPENYPLSLNALANACNQSTNRDPISNYDEKTIDDGLLSLREKKLAMVVFGAGSRVQKYKHRLPEHYTLEPKETGLICVLLLRGAQTLGELRTRTERFYGFPDLESVRICLEDLAKPGTELVRLLPQRPGQKEQRYIQLLSSPSAIEESSIESSVTDSIPSAPRLADRVETLEKQVTDLQTELQRVREELATFRKQFE